ncbi:hypothetical protein AOC03_00265 [Psychrobacter urativorans]|uniref:Excalibur calcium-binding domain-containing protein n=1 Tax=Psychrobacter urativorans TaxID=45610 RepID=A0A0M4U304_9GAMM|nr:excalibur calcium-binding domain-containing protein [Psychrobacter urativorans]ALF58669.1 hypothetical protein AOC03_00265 [Psychrobacter urativorans]
MKQILIIMALCVLAFYGYQKFQVTETESATTVPTFTAADLENIPPSYNDSSPEPQALTTPMTTATNTSPNTPSFTCDGRQHCSQMKSCEEATYFIKHCPNTKMDGNNDGIPCEDQFCR